MTVLLPARTKSRSPRTTDQTEPPRRRISSGLGRGVSAVLAASLAIGAVPSVSLAQKPAGGPSQKDLDAAKKAFFEGLDLEKAEKWSEALKRFEEVAKVRMTPQVRFHIALCKEKMGLLLEALRDFEQAEADAKSEKVPTVLKEAPEHAAAIKGRIPKLKLKLPSDVEKLSVTVDGAAIDAQGADEIALNPGTHKVEASAEGREPFSAEVPLAEGESKTLIIKLPKPGEPQKDPDPPPPPPTPSPKKGPPVLAFVVGGVGVLALLGAGGFYLARSSVKRDLDDACGEGGQHCPADRADAIANGRTYTTLTNVFAIVGLVGVSAGVVLYVTSSKGDEAPKASLRLLPSAPGANVGGLSLTGAF